MPGLGQLPKSKDVVREARHRHWSSDCAEGSIERRSKRSIYDLEIRVALILQGMAFRTAFLRDVQVQSRDIVEDTHRDFLLSLHLRLPASQP